MDLTPAKLSPVLYRLRSTQNIHILKTFLSTKDAEISFLLSHFNANCDNICVKAAECYNLWGAFENALCRSNDFVFSMWLFVKGV